MRESVRIDWYLREHWRVRGRPWWRHLWSCRVVRGNREGKLDSFGDTFGAGPQNVDAMTSVVIRGGSEIPTIDTVGGPGAAVAG